MLSLYCIPFVCGVIEKVWTCLLSHYALIYSCNSLSYGTVVVYVVDDLPFLILIDALKS